MNDAGWFNSGTATVRSDWIDYNGHMNVGYYLVAFDIATEQVCVHFGLGEAYRRASDASIFVLEAHVTYDREVVEDAPLAFRTRIVDHDAKRFHLLHHMYHAEEGFLAATNELMCMHIDLTTKRAAPMPETALAKVQALHAAHAATGALDGIGRRIGIRRKT
ncbi:MAG: thioesterase family protein [Alphaproteobacteria bacterium]|nr:thioesterase family protein [Alphaproteobacteria bacterium]